MQNTNLPTTTRAVRIFTYGGPEVLRYGEYPLPELGPRDALVEVAAASVTFWDVKYRTGPQPGTPPGLFPLPQQLGREASGTVLAVGAEVTRVKAGDRVVGAVHPADLYHDDAIRGAANLSRMKMPGHQVTGCYAQYLVRDEHEWLAVPEGLSLAEAAVTVWSFATSHRVIVDRLRVKLGDTVLIAGASGAMGRATAQLARLAGARVIGTTRSETKAGALREHLDGVVVTRDPAHAAEQVRRLTGGQGADHAIEYTGNREMLEFVAAALRPGGQIVIAAGEGGSEPVPFTPARFLVQELTLLGVRAARANDARMALHLAGEGRIHSTIAARFPLSEAAEAHKLAESSEVNGRIILEP